MRQIRFAAIAFVGLVAAIASSFITAGANAASPNQPTTTVPTTTRLFQLQQLAQRGGDCRGQQILQAQTCAGDGLEPEEAKLYQMVNQYRAQNGLPPIPLSKSLTLVANRHVLDLAKNIGSLTHGWSDCAYDAGNSSTWPCMWEAPQRLGTAYSGRGYENAHGGSGRYRASAASALRGWQRSSPHNAVILNQGIWQGKQWNALGIGIYRGYAVLWFGEEPDPANTANATSDRQPSSPSNDYETSITYTSFDGSGDRSWFND
jgi:hypothetical protein